MFAGVCVPAVFDTEQDYQSRGESSLGATYVHSIMYVLLAVTVSLAYDMPATVYCAK